MQRKCDTLRTRGKRIVLVPTMGYLHEGHPALAVKIEKTRLIDNMVLSPKSAAGSKPGT